MIFGLKLYNKGERFFLVHIENIQCGFHAFLLLLLLVVSLPHKIRTQKKMKICFYMPTSKRVKKLVYVLFYTQTHSKSHVRKSLLRHQYRFACLKGKKKFLRLESFLSACTMFVCICLL
jgi:hypothetical protein